MTKRSQSFLRWLAPTPVWVCLSVAAMGAQIRCLIDVPRGYSLPDNVEVALNMASGSRLESGVAQGNGHFTFEHLGEGSYVIVVRAEGFRPASQDVNVPSGFLGGTPFNVTIRLFPEVQPEGRPPNEKTVQVKSLQVPAEAVEQVHLAEEAAARGSLDEAIQYTEKAVEIYPAYFAAYNNLAVYHYQAGHPNRAVRYFERALVLNPDAAATNSNLGRVLLDLHRPEQALRYLEHAAELAPTSGEIQYHLGRALIVSGRYSESTKPLRRALESLPPIEHAHFLLAHVLYELEDIQGAINELTTYLKTDPEDERELKNLLKNWKDEAKRR